MSGIYIKGMEMPKCCLVCTFNYDMYVCELSGASTLMVQDGGKIPICPLIAVPDHGRLIDADALAHDLDDDVENDQRALDEMDFVGKERKRVQFDKDCKQNCMWYLSNAPTIIPAEKDGADDV